MIDIHLFTRGTHSLIAVKLEGLLTQAEYQVFLSHFESEIRHHADLRLFFEFEVNLSWEARSCWRSLKFDSRHRTSIAKMAVVGGGSAWHTWLQSACKPLNIARTFRFSASQRGQAVSWLKA